MGYIIIGIVIVLVCASIALAWRMRPRHGDHEAPRGYDLDFYPATLAPLPAAEAPWRPRAVPDVDPPNDHVSVALSAVRHPCYQYAARLAAMSWQSHRTLQRNYDVLAFATVARSYYRMGASYAG